MNKDRLKYRLKIQERVNEIQIQLIKKFFDVYYTINKNGYLNYDNELYFIIKLDMNTFEIILESVDKKYTIDLNDIDLTKIIEHE